MKTIFNNRTTMRIGYLSLIALVLVIFSCEKKTIIGDDPYAGGKEALGIKFDNTLPDPSSAAQGDEVTVFVRGLKKFEGKFKLYVNEMEADVLAFTDSTARIRIPTTASTGGLSVVAEQQTFFGPILTIDGKVSIDATFNANGATYRDNTGGFTTAAINDMINLPSGNYIFVGGFNNYDNKWTEALPIGGIVQTDPVGTYVAPTTTFGFGIGANGGVNTITRLESGPHNGKYIIAGYFTTFVSPKRKNYKLNTISSITRINANGTLDSAVIDVINPTPNLVYKNNDTIPAFNGGVDGNITKAFVYGDRVYVVGSFKNYVRRYYDRATYDNKPLDLVRMNQLVAMKINQTNAKDEGDIDLTFHYNSSTKQSPIGANGNINDAIQMPDGKLVLVGAFTTFNGTAVNRIVRLNLDGSIDASFNTGGGADNDIQTITYNKTTGKILIAGLFKNFGGQAQSGVALLNADGTKVSTFNLGLIEEGIPTFAGQLNSGKIIVSGTFKKYNSVIRQGFMIINPDGSLAEGYNNTGQFQGEIVKFSETTSGTNTRITLVGRIARFDNKTFRSVVRINLKN